MSQNHDIDKILAYLQQGHSLTFLDAERMFGTISIRERIRDLRHRGWPIKTSKVQNPNTKRFHAVYFMAAETDHPEIRRANHLAETAINELAVK